MHRLSARAAEELHRLAESDGEWPYQLADGEVRIVCAPLPGRAVVGVERQDDVLWIVVDIAKPAARTQLAALIDNWPLGHGEGAQAQWKMDDIVDMLTPFSAEEVEDGAPMITKQETV